MDGQAVPGFRVRVEVRVRVRVRVRAMVRGRPYTMCGWWKAPIRFLPAGTLMAVLPPTLESIIAVLEVGTWPGLG